LIHVAPTAVHPWSPSKLVWLSGASDPRTCALSSAQLDLLESCGPTDVCARNFPYVEPRRWAGRRPPGLLLASTSNVLQFALASTPLFRRATGRHWAALCASTQQLLVVAGSCGAQFLRQLEPITPLDVALHSLALGPVAWRAPRSLELAVIGGRDRIARIVEGMPRAVEVVRPAGVGHMGYLADESVRRVVREWVRLKRGTLSTRAEGAA
jgi:hypothetical protein